MKLIKNIKLYVTKIICSESSLEYESLFIAYKTYGPIYIDGQSLAENIGRGVRRLDNNPFCMSCETRAVVWVE